MQQSRRRGWPRTRPIATVLVAALTPLALLAPATILDASSAAASPAAGYTADFIPTGIGINLSIAINPVTDTIYGASSADKLLVVGGSSHAILATIALPARPAGIAVDSATDIVYVSVGTATPEIVVIDGKSNSVSATIQLPASAQGLAIDDATSRLYAAEPGTSSVLAIDTSANAIVANVSTGGRAYGVAVDQSRDVVWVANSSGSVAAINGATNSLIQTPLAVGGKPLSVAVNPVTDTVYVADMAYGAASANVAVINGAARSITATVALPGVNAVTVDPGSDVVYATFAGVLYLNETGTPFGESWIIDGASNTVVDTIDAGGNLAAVDTATGSAYMPIIRGTPGVWAITPSAANAMSPIVLSPFGKYALFTTGVAGRVSLLIGGLPTPALTETGALPGGVTFTSTGVLSGTPLPGVTGVFPITITASNGISPAFSIAITLTVDAEAVGVEGSDGGLWVQAPQLGSGWHSLGGQISAPPAIAAIVGGPASTLQQPYFIATGTTGKLYIRSLTAGWQLIGPATMTCIGGPAALVTGVLPQQPFTLTVACRGADNALWVNSAPLPASGLPQFTSPWTNLGGILSAGPAIATTPITVTFFVRGVTGAIYTRTMATGYSLTPWSCSSQPAAATVLPGASGTAYFACQGPDHALWESEDAGGAGWTPLVSMGGSLIGGPAIAAPTTAPLQLLAEGTTHALWTRTSSTGWVPFGGTAVGGVGAVALS